MLQTTEHCHIVRNTQILSGEPIIKNTMTPVRVIVQMWQTGISPEEISDRFPHLSLSQIFDALSYYLDHPAEINDYIAGDRLSVDSTKQLRPFGLCAGEFTVPDDFDAPLPEDILNAFEG